MKKISIFFVVINVFFINITTAFEIGDGQYSGIYNEQDFDVSQSRFNKITGAKQNDVPVGTIISWSLPTNPEDFDYWLECNGQDVDRNKYPQLYALMTKTPDFRGRFLVGANKDRKIGSTEEPNLAKHQFDGAYYKTSRLKSSQSLEPYDCSYWEHIELDSTPHIQTLYKCQHTGASRGRWDCDGDSNCGYSILSMGQKSDMTWQGCGGYCAGIVGGGYYFNVPCPRGVGYYYACHRGGCQGYASCQIFTGPGNEREAVCGYDCVECPAGYILETATCGAKTPCKKWIEKTCYRDSSTYYDHTLTVANGNEGNVVPLKTASNDSDTRPTNFSVRYFIRAKSDN